MHRILKAAIAIIAVGSFSVMADMIDFFGTFTKDNDVVFIEFTVEDPMDVTISSSSWSAGGIDPFLTIFDASGTQLTSTGYEYDFSYVDNGEYLAAGDTYIASITQFPNFAIGNLLEGFTFDAEENFMVTQEISDLPFGGSGADPHNGYWNLVFTGVSDAKSLSVPEPGILSLLLLGLAFLPVAAVRRRK